MQLTLCVSEPVTRVAYICIQWDRMSSMSVRTHAMYHWGYSKLSTNNKPAVDSLHSMYDLCDCFSANRLHNYARSMCEHDCKPKEGCDCWSVNQAQLPGSISQKKHTPFVKWVSLPVSDHVNDYSQSRGLMK